MAETTKLGLPLLDAAQAQKHVTVNEALVRLDAWAAGRVASVGANSPPAAPAEGESHVVGAVPGGAWAGRAGALAFSVNGGWEFVTPSSGARIHDAATGRDWRFDGAAWVADALGSGPRGAATLLRVIEASHSIASGPESITAAVMPDKAIVLGVTARVDEAIGGASAWSLGVADDPGRYGSGLGTGEGSFAHGVTGAPVAYYGATPLLLTAEGGTFTGGAVRLAVHVLELAPPRAV